MINKIVASVISSVVLFACNVKDDTPVASEDVAASVADVHSVPDPAPAPAVVQPQPDLPAVAPLGATGVTVDTTASTPAPSTLTTPAVPAPSVTAPSASTVVAPVTSTPVK